MTAVRGQGTDVHRRFGVGRQHGQGLARPELRKRGARFERGKGAGQTAGIEQPVHTITRLMTAQPLAVILASSDLQRLYTGLSLLVCAAAEGRSARGLVTFGALEALVDEGLERLALQPAATPQLSAEGRKIFARSLAELCATAATLELCELHACSAAMETTGVSADAVARRLDGVISTPRFLREVGQAELVVV